MPQDPSNSQSVFFEVSDSRYTYPMIDFFGVILSPPVSTRNDVWMSLLVHQIPHVLPPSSYGSDVDVGRPGNKAMHGESTLTQYSQN